MEVVTGGMSPFHNHDVHEWSRLNSLTGVLERARLETDHWTANTTNTSHKYGKVVDCRARSDAHGSVQQAKRQLEVFQSDIPGGHLQVIKTRTVTTSSSNQRTTNSFATTTERRGGDQNSTTIIGKNHQKCTDFEDLKLPLNPLDVSSQKSKASVGRSVGRRPPTRPKVREETFPSASFRNHQSTTSNASNNLHTTASINLHRVSRLCHQIHDHAVKNGFGGDRRQFAKSTSKSLKCATENIEKLPINERESGDGVEIIEIETENVNHNKLTRTKSSSSEDLHLIYDKEKNNKSVEDLEDLEQLQTWRRASKLRRSLQFPKQNNTVTNKPSDLPENTGSVRRIREDLETGRRLNTALRGNNVNLESLDQILQSISSSSSVQSDKSDKPSESDYQTESRKEKRHSFVTVESLQEVKGRLRRTSCQSDDLPCSMTIKKEEETDDDGIGSEDFGSKIITNTKSNSSSSCSNSSSSAKVKSYVYGLESMMNKENMLGTGSLESRTSKQTNSSSSINRNDDWYNRRKSYGFEKVHNEPNKSVSLKNKDVMESSTDSGICKSNDTMDLPLSSSLGNVKRFSSIFESNNSNFENQNKDESSSNMWNRNVQKNKNELESRTVTIPIKLEAYKRQLSDRTGGRSLMANSSAEVKRHSIAVDETKYINNNVLRINEVADEGTDEENPNVNRKQKKVEFCKTEVHFAPDSGKINIIETAEKPPPTSNFRRRRRNSGSSYVEMIEECNKKGLPTLHFGDNYELHKQSQSARRQTENTVTVTTNGNIHEYFESNGEDKENSESDIPKGILKNKLIKPKPYILGDVDNSFQKNTEPPASNEIWGVKLKPVKREEQPIWKSTVTLKNYYENKREFENRTDVSKPLKFDELHQENNEKSGDKIRLLSSDSDEKQRKFVRNQIDEQQKSESKGFSTKVNIGSNDLTFVQNENIFNGSNRKDQPSAWTMKDDVHLNRKRELNNRSLVVHIGQNYKSTSQKSLLNDNCDSKRKTTTKITIDLTPSPSTEKTKKFSPSYIEKFKSTPLVLNTFKTEYYNSDKSFQGIPDENISIPQQLEALKRLYEDALSDNEADKEVQRLMNRSCCESSKETDDECNSIVSGSWSKLRAYKLMNQEKHKSQQSAYNTENALIEKDSRSRSHNLNDRISHVQNNSLISFDRKDKGWEKHKVETKVPRQLLSTTNKDQTHSEEHYYETLSKYNEKDLSSQEKIYENETIPSKDTYSCNFKQVADKKSKTRSPSPHAKIRTKTSTPRSYMTKNLQKTNQDYFEVKENSPPLVHHYLKKKNNEETTARLSKGKEEFHKNSRFLSSNRGLSPERIHKTHAPVNNKTSSHLYKQKTSSNSRKVEIEKRVSPVQNESKLESPIYENIDEVLEKPSKTHDFDSSILEELTKAADQILQAVSDYANDETLLNEEDNIKVQPKLETITESKSWKQKNSKEKSCRKKEVKPVKRTSSTSSLESTPDRKNSSNSSKKGTDFDKYKKKTTDPTTTRAATKARRLQRANSREALLLSHGSSSEDLKSKDETPIRKPRIIRKTKYNQFKISNGLDINIKSTTGAVRNYGNHITSEEKVQVAALPEIRHKTAVSTIRSTAEKMASREKANKLKSVERRKLSLSSSKKENNLETSKDASEVMKQPKTKQNSKKR